MPNLSEMGHFPLNALIQQIVFNPTGLLFSMIEKFELNFEQNRCQAIFD